MNTARLTYLYQQYQLRQLTQEESMEWEAAVSDRSNDDFLLTLVDKDWYLEDFKAPVLIAGEQEKIFNYVVTQSQNSRKTRSLWPRIGIAAAVAAIIISAGIWFLKNPAKENPTQQLAYVNDIAPGKNAATLTLANGKKIVINDALIGNIANQSGIKISKTKDGQIIYEVSGNNSGTLEYNTLSTSRGEQTRLRLPDGSLVYLNAASSLTYPASFAALTERRVKLSGEGYFEIAKDKAHPFVVESDRQSIKVLGTHFNINAYDDEAATKTTLLEGSVRVNAFSSERIILKPGEQSQLGKTGLLKVITVNPDEAIAWKNGKFEFNEENIESIMRKLARWYNVEVVYEGDFSKRTFVGTISRSDNISKILDKITFTQAVRFKIEGRRITVMP